MRTNLLQRLKPNVIIGLANNKPKYFDVITKLEITLKNKIFYSDLSIEEIKSVLLFADVENYNRSNWDWRFGEDIFDKEEEVC
jgi:hypothetical protein